MPVKAQLANGARHAARRRFYFVAANSPAHQFFDAGFTPISPRLVNTAQVTLQQGPSSGSSGPSAQQSKGAQSSSTQPPTSTLVLPLPLGGATPGSGASGRANTGSTHNGATGGMHIPTAGNFATPSFFPSILGSSEKSQSRSTKTPPAKPRRRSQRGGWRWWRATPCTEFPRTRITRRSLSDYIAGHPPSCSSWPRSIATEFRRSS